MRIVQDDLIILSSNVKTYGFENTISHFWTKLRTKRNFSSNEDWRIALTSITYKPSWYNVRETRDGNFITQIGEVLKFDTLRPSFKIHAGDYTSTQHLIDAINTEMAFHKNTFISTPKLYFNPINKIVKIIPGISAKFDSNYLEFSKEKTIKIFPDLGEEIENLLGLIDENKLTTKDRLLNQLKKMSDPEKHQMSKMIFGNDKIKGFSVADINSGFNNMFIYSNIVQHCDIGDVHAQIITTVPKERGKDGWDGNVHFEPINKVYRPLQVRSFDTIEIDIRDESGKKIPFKSGNVVLHLHLVRYK